jgi:2-methylcitrate dehydratase PrpD
MLEVTQQLAKFIADLRYEDIPVEVIDRSKLLMSDLIGIGVRARHGADSTLAMMRATEILGADGGTCGVFGDSRWYSPAAAALMNGALGHSLDFDDTHAAASVHPSAVVVPAALAAAQLPGASSRDVIVAIIAGYETICRLGQALGPDDHYERGYHPTATCGAFASTVAASKVMGLNAKEIESALGIALSQASGTMQFVENGAWTMRYQVGNAAKNGLVAASFAREGFIGATHPLEGRYGFLHAFAPSPDPRKVIAGLGTLWETMNIAVKPYPVCRLAHTAVDAIIDLKREHGFASKDLASVVIELPELAYDLTGAPELQKRMPENLVDAQFSVHFMSAVALIKGRIYWDEFRKHLHDKDTTRLMRRISAMKTTDGKHSRYRTRMSIALSNATSLNRTLELPKGEFGNFLPSFELRSKFRSLVAPCIGKKGEERLHRTIMNFETESVDDLFHRTVPANCFLLAGED